jgi:hypothetical protein
LSDKDKKKSGAGRRRGMRQRSGDGKRKHGKRRHNGDEREKQRLIARDAWKRKQPPSVDDVRFSTAVAVVVVKSADHSAPSNEDEFLHISVFHP